MTTLFVTGASGLLGGEALACLLAQDPEMHAYVLVREPARWPAHAHACGIDVARTRVLAGDITLPDLGLDRWTRARVAATTDVVLHAAANTSFSQTIEAARRVNVEGTRSVLTLAGQMSQARFVFVSTAFVAGTRTGLIREDGDGDDDGDGFIGAERFGRLSDAAPSAGAHASPWVNAYEQSKAEAEALVRAYAGAWTILRPSTVVFDTVRGTVPQVNAVHRALRMCWNGLAPMLPGTETTPVDVVTSDYVADAVAALVPRRDLGGRTIHLCAGDGALPLGELLALCWRVWSRDPEWRRRAIERPALAELDTYQLFERTVLEAGDARFRRVMASLSHFAPQLALPKRFDTANADALLGFRAPAVRDFWPPMLSALLDAGWTTQRTRRAA